MIKVNGFLLNTEIEQNLLAIHFRVNHSPALVSSILKQLVRHLVSDRSHFLKKSKVPCLIDSVTRYHDCLRSGNENYVVKVILWCYHVIKMKVACLLRGGFVIKHPTDMVRLWNVIKHLADLCCAHACNWIALKSAGDTWLFLVQQVPLWCSGIMRLLEVFWHLIPEINISKLIDDICWNLSWNFW